ncbi:MAG: hypothetical protein ABI325_02200 [Ginsengibacter sp.]
MNKPLHQFFTEDHHRINQLLNKAIEQPGEIEMNYYHQFRTRLLRHIKMEEKTLFPAAKKANYAVMQALIPRYRLEHGALTALMVPPPTSSLIKVIMYILEKHDMAEEEPGGLYDVCEALTHGQTQELLDQLAGTEEVPVHPPNAAPIAIESARRALTRAGYDPMAIGFDEIIRRSN